LDEIRLSDEALDVKDLGFHQSLALAVTLKGKLATFWGKVKEHSY